MPISFKPGLLVLVLCLSSSIVSASWDQEELEIFDVVEEVNQNFYEVLGLPQNCTSGEIKKAYRKLSLQLHPDKNDAPDAEVKFRQLVGIYEVLRDDGKRARYDRVLVEGLPNWRNPLYYYRRYRKMGMTELSIWLFVLFSIGQYAVAWGSYFEKKLTLEQVKASTLKKLQKQMKKTSGKAKSNEVEEELSKQFEIPKPTVKNTLPFQIVRAIIAFPALIRWILHYREELRKEAEAKKQQEKEEAEALERENEEMEREKERRATRRKRVQVLPEYGDDDSEDECVLDGVDDPLTADLPKAPPRISGGFWSDEDLAELARYMKKYPAGTMERWEKIADALNRTVNEVCHFARKIKDNAFRPPEEQENQEERVERRKEKTRGGKNNFTLAEPTQADVVVGEDQAPGSSGWTQKQQKSLETALATYTKGSTERWERIAKAVPGKTKEECMMRVKYLSDMVKKKKQMEEERQKSEDGSQERTSAEGAGDNESVSSESSRPERSQSQAT